MSPTVVPPKAADEDHCTICCGTGWDFDQFQHPVACACTKQKTGEQTPEQRELRKLDNIIEMGGTGVPDNYKRKVSS